MTGDGARLAAVLEEYRTEVAELRKVVAELAEIAATVAEARRIAATIEVRDEWTGSGIGGGMGGESISRPTTGSVERRDFPGGLVAGAILAAIILVAGAWVL